jgi:hypothetical protein
MGAIEGYLGVGLVALYIYVRKGTVLEIDRIARRAQMTNEHELRRVLERFVEPFTNPLSLVAILITAVPLFLLFWPIAFPIMYRAMVKMYQTGPT